MNRNEPQLMQNALRRCDKEMSYFNKFRTEGALFQYWCMYCNYKNIVEIGVQHAKTTGFLCQAALHTGGRVLGFDTFTPVGMYEEDSCGNLPLCERVLHQYKGLVKLIKADSQSEFFPKILEEELLNYTGGDIDFAFIDGDHSYEGVKKDFFNIYPFLSPYGSIAFHDTNSHIGARKFLIELRTSYNDGTFDIITLPFGVDGHGMSILMKRGFIGNDGITFDHLSHEGGTAFHGNDASLKEEDVYTMENEWLQKQILATDFSTEIDANQRHEN
tara:strand:+ start:1671 stop:2489 length:819 start_codon:yes stop_codon:yes gene_type:complete